MNLKNFFVALIVAGLFNCSAYSRELTEKETARFEKYFAEASALITPYMNTADDARADHETPIVRGDLKRSISLLKKAIRLNPDSWQAYRLMGAAHRALWELNDAYLALHKAYLNVPEDPDITSEYIVSLIELDRTDDALEVSRDAIKKFPDRADIRIDHGLALLLNGKVEEAFTQIEKTMAHGTENPEARKLLEYIGGVKTGKKPCPKSYWEMVLNGK